MQRGKHRGCSIIDEKYKYFILNFPYRAPIKETLHTEVASEPSNNTDFENPNKKVSSSDTEFDF